MEVTRILHGVVYVAFKHDDSWLTCHVRLYATEKEARDEVDAFNKISHRGFGYARYFVYELGNQLDFDDWNYLGPDDYDSDEEEDDYDSEEEED